MVAAATYLTDASADLSTFSHTVPRVVQILLLIGNSQNFSVSRITSCEILLSSKHIPPIVVTPFPIPDHPSLTLVEGYARVFLALP